ncbi:MAG: 2-dehydro-3-deoxygalactonokinase [Gracilibacteraceae bacterium]|jgi:2-dehydro-3-deoxygalactonokinase|nr:2-dehydro-3-deoxygalactonokinase [Gracilibacteraceae bacterium]
MMRITIDCGTTNTRAILWESGGRMAGEQSRPVGVRDTATEGSNAKLKQAVKSCLDSLLLESGAGYSAISSIIASGMISSNVGLAEIPHLTAPAGLRELARGIARKELPDICPLPIYFIPGIKNSAEKITLANYLDMDVMRGEETESVALIRRLHKGKPMLLILPGSHTKFVGVDEEGRITGCITTLAGELLAAISRHTVIADAVERRLADPGSYNRRMALEGYESALKHGLGRACFSARILSNFTDHTPPDIASFILGAVLAGDITAVKASSLLAAHERAAVVLTGREPLRQALYDILSADDYFRDIHVYTPETDVPLSAEGALLIAGGSEYDL